MLNYMQSGVLVVVAMLVSVFMVLVLNWVWPIPNRKLINDVTGWQLGILGTTYGVILGFMLYTVWIDFRAAEINASREASSVLTVTRIASALPVEAREEFRTLGIKYADAVVNQEWPAMQHQEESSAGEMIEVDMWRLLAAVKDQAGSANSVDHLTQVLSDLSERRGLREEQLRVRLPVVLWILLLAGGGATVLSSCVLGNDNKWLHYCQVLALTFVVAVTLTAIADLARPFEGAVSVSPIAFERVEKMMQSDAGH
ncbi:DUF4239 domain-containing protein [Tunturiibacter gelidoferens]|jgi:hypothetical protein|uniref:DUF4239 domain-containing protein n=1 Tax=Tunturiibacter gelidiferens TaxID=3069689 RepID=A0A9X0QD37_9BACT|nr:DUF4239 domain-containing protein [Edaphobacter lichenicola]MBB5328143.1 hypothetical protein [Edaphobacter lichenicola]